MCEWKGVCFMVNQTLKSSASIQYINISNIRVIDHDHGSIRVCRNCFTVKISNFLKKQNYFRY